MKSNLPNDDDFELQPAEVTRHSNAGPQPVAPHHPVDPAHPILPEPDSVFGSGGPSSAPSIPDDAPPPREKVDFENLPAFVAQRKMLRTVRIVAIIVSVILAIILAVAFFGTGKGAHDSMKPYLGPNGETIEPPKQGD